LLGVVVTSTQQAQQTERVRRTALSEVDLDSVEVPASAGGLSRRHEVDREASYCTISRELQADLVGLATQ
jgi:hypothetical protein